MGNTEGKTRMNNEELAYIAGFLDDFVDAERAVGVCVMNGGWSDGKPPRCGLDHAFRTDFAGFQGGSDGDGFHRRAWLENVGDAAIARAVAVQLDAVVRVVGG